jgi:hypothetical protein
MNRILITLYFFVLISLGCSKESNVIVEDNSSDLPEGISGITSYQYQFLETAPTHTQTSMLTGYQNKLYRFGSKWPVQVLDLLSKS